MTNPCLCLKRLGFAVLYQFVPKNLAQADISARKVFSDKVRMTYLQLPIFTKKVEQCDNDFDKWIYVLKNMETLTFLIFFYRHTSVNIEVWGILLMFRIWLLCPIKLGKGGSYGILHEPMLAEQCLREPRAESPAIP